MSNQSGHTLPHQFACRVQLISAVDRDVAVEISDHILNIPKQEDTLNFPNGFVQRAF